MSKGEKVWGWAYNDDPDIWNGSALRLRARIDTYNFSVHGLPPWVNIHVMKKTSMLRNVEQNSLSYD